MNPFRLALLGAPGTGKTQLARDLVASLAAVRLATGQRRLVVDDDPQATEEAAIASAASSHSSPSSPSSALLAARTGLEAFDLILLMGTDLVSGSSSRTTYDADTAIRARLTAGELAFRVIYGRGEDRLQNALNAISSANGTALVARRVENRGAGRKTGAEPGVKSEASRWTWSCDKCSDPDCEHALFTKLLKERATRPA